MLLNTRNKNIYGLGVGISTVFDIYGHFLYQGGTGPLRMVMTYIDLLFYVPFTNMTSPLRVKGCKIKAYARRSGPLSREGSLLCHICCDTGPRFFWSHPKDRPIQSPLTTHEGMWRIYSNLDPHGVPHSRNNLGVGISMVFEIIRHFLLNGGRDHHVRSWLTYHQMLLDTTNKNGLGVGISTVFEIFGQFLFKGGRHHPVWSWPAYHQMLLDTRNKNIYTVLGWRLKQFSRHKYVIHCAPTRPPGTMTLTNVHLYYLWKLSCKFELFGPIGSWEDFLNMFPLKAHVKIVSPIVASPNPRELWF
jgi:hypothetical protein